jgi:branched-chain amino acid transport system substrate-binding protein
MKWGKPMKRLMALAMILLLLSACSNGNVEKTSGTKDKSVVIGAWLPLTGPAAVYGNTQRAGLGSYYKMINDNGGVNGKKIDFRIEDSGRDPQQTVAASHKLIEQDKVFAIVSPFGTAQSEATFSYVLDSAKVPILDTYGGLETWYKPARANLYGVMMTFENQARALGRWAAKDGAKNILVVHDDPAAYETVGKAVQPGAVTANSKVNVKLLPVKLGTADYSPIALQIANSKPDAIVMIQPIDELVALAKALERQNVKIPLYTYAPNVSQDSIKLGGTAIEGLRAMSWTVSPTSDTPEVKEYREALKKYDSKAVPDFQSLFTWAEAKIFVEAMKRVDGEPTHEKFTKALETMKNYKTNILPPVTFSPDNHLGVQELQPVKLEKGEWKVEGGFIDPTKAW